MSNLAVRGLAQEGALVTAGLGPTLGELFLSAVSGIITMVGSLGAVFMASTGATDAQKNQGGESIQINIGID